MAYLQAYSAGQSGWTATQCGIHRTGEKRNLVHQNILMNSTVTLLGICNKRTSLVFLSQHETKEPADNQPLANGVASAAKLLFGGHHLRLCKPCAFWNTKGCKVNFSVWGYSRCTKSLTHTTHTQDTGR